MSQTNIYKDAIETFGAYAQLIVAAEECSELSAAILHFIRFGEDKYKVKVEEEIADVMLMINQLFLIFDTNSINFFKVEKIKRLVTRIKQAKINAKYGQKPPKET